MNKNDNKDYVEIYNKIAHGLKEDYVEPETGHVWKVTEYLSGKNKGVPVFTRHGKFLGTAYPFIVYSGGVKGGHSGK